MLAVNMPWVFLESKGHRVTGYGSGRGQVARPRCHAVLVQAKRIKLDEKKAKNTEYYENKKVGAKDAVVRASGGLCWGELFSPGPGAE